MLQLTVDHTRIEEKQCRLKINVLQGQPVYTIIIKKKNHDRCGAITFVTSPLSLTNIGYTHCNFLFFLSLIGCYTKKYWSFRVKSFKCAGSFVSCLQCWMQRNKVTIGASIVFIYGENKYIAKVPQMLHKPELIWSLANKPATIIN